MDKNVNNKIYPDVIKFIRQKDFLFRSELGKGACGEGKNTRYYVPILEAYKSKDMDLVNKLAKEIG